MEAKELRGLLLLLTEAKYNKVPVELVAVSMERLAGCRDRDGALCSLCHGPGGSKLVEEYWLRMRKVRPW